MRKALVITPTTGADELADCITSVKNQTYPHTDHLIVVDGQDYSSKVDRVLSKTGVIGSGKKFFRCDLPFNTGGGGYYGHRVMAAFGHLIPDYNYVLFLDQDNWYDNNHVESLVGVCEDKGYAWSYSLRKIYDKDKNFITEDNCESLGKWSAWVGDNAFLVDTSSFCFQVPFFQLYSHLWDFGWGADRRFLFLIEKLFKKERHFECSYKHTLNYRLGGNDGSVTKEFFEEGNAKMLERFNGVLPWKK